MISNRAELCVSLVPTRIFSECTIFFRSFRWMDSSWCVSASRSFLLAKCQFEPISVRPPKENLFWRTLFAFWELSSRRTRRTRREKPKSFGGSTKFNRSDWTKNSFWRFAKDIGFGKRSEFRNISLLNERSACKWVCRYALEFLKINKSNPFEFRTVLMYFSIASTNHGPRLYITQNCPSLPPRKEDSF